MSKENGLRWWLLAELGERRMDNKIFLLKLSVMSDLIIQLENHHQCKVYQALAH